MTEPDNPVDQIERYLDKVEEILARIRGVAQELKEQSVDDPDDT